MNRAKPWKTTLPSVVGHEASKATGKATCIINGTTAIIEDLKLVACNSVGREVAYCADVLRLGYYDIHIHSFASELTR